MKTDTLKRRLRFAPPQPFAKGIVLSGRDIRIFETIHRHGPLPTNYLHEGTRDIGRNYGDLQHRLTTLYNGNAEGAYLTRPAQQFASFEARYQPAIYDLAPRAQRVLTERGLLARYSPKRTDPFLHRFMSACVSFSLEHSCAAGGMNYIPKETIFASEKCPETAKHSDNPLAIPLSLYDNTKFIVPDDLFGIRFPDGRHRFFAVEIDRNTESIERRTRDQNAFGRKLQGYLNVFANRTYRAHWGLPNLRALTVTTNISHATNLLHYLRKQPGITDRFLFQHYAGFGTNWRVPRQVLDVFGPWASISGSVSIFE